MNIKNVSRLGLLVSVAASLAACAPSKTNMKDVDTSSILKVNPQVITADAQAFNTSALGKYENKDKSKSIEIADGVLTLTEKSKVSVDDKEAECYTALSLLIFDAKSADDASAKQFSQKPTTILSLQVVAFSSVKDSTGTMKQSKDCNGMIVKAQDYLASANVTSLGFSQIGKDKIRIFEEAEEDGTPARVTDYTKVRGQSQTPQSTHVAGSR